MKTSLADKKQAGFTLIELVIVIGLAGIIAAAITGTILGVFSTDARTRNSMSALYQVRQAGKLVTEDVLQAKPPLNLGENSGFPLTLTQDKIVDGTTHTHTVTYSLVDMPAGELKRLKRSESVDGGDPVVSIVAEYIDPDPDMTRCSLEGDVLVFKVTATVGGQSKTETFRVEPRVG